MSPWARLVRFYAALVVLVFSVIAALPEPGHIVLEAVPK